MEKRKKSCPEIRGFSESSDWNGMGDFLSVFHVWWISGHRRLFLTKGRLWVSFLSTIQGPWQGAPHSQSVGPLGITGLSKGQLWLCSHPPSPNATPALRWNDPTLKTTLISGGAGV